MAQLPRLTQFFFGWVGIYMFSNPNVFYIWDQIGALVSLWPTRQFLFNNHTRVQMGTVLRGKYENSYRTQMRRHCGAVLSCVSSEDSVGDTTVVVPRSHAWHRQQTISSSTRSSTAVPSYLVLTGPRDKVKIITSTRKKKQSQDHICRLRTNKKKELYTSMSCIASCTLAMTGQQCRYCC